MACCTHIISRGKRKGDVCGKSAYYDGFCHTHKKFAKTDECPICLADKPQCSLETCSSCSQSACKPCLTKWFRRDISRDRCPFCRAENTYPSCRRSTSSRPRDPNVYDLRNQLLEMALGHSNIIALPQSQTPILCVDERMDIYHGDLAVRYDSQQSEQRSGVMYFQYREPPVINGYTQADRRLFEFTTRGNEIVENLSYTYTS